MTSTDLFRPTTTAAPDEHATLLVALELSRSSWLVAVSAPGADRVSRHDVAAGDGAALLGLLERLKRRAERANERPTRVVTIQEAGFDGFWLHRLLEAKASSHVVDAASVAVNRRQRRAKTDRIDLTCPAHPGGIPAWRAPGLLDGAPAVASGRGPQAGGARAPTADHREDPAPQPDQRLARNPGNCQLRAGAR